MTNLDLWNSLEKTDPKYTKEFNRAGFKGTATNGTYIIRKLTEVFGPCGQGWRFELEDERYVIGHKLKSGDASQVHVIRGHLKYRTEAVNGMWFQTSPQFGQTTFVGENKNGTFTDEEAPKKSITDCIAKCAVMLGICADIHMGMFDDNKYVNQRKQEEAAAAAPQTQQTAANPSAQQESPTKSREWAKTVRDSIAGQVKNAKDLIDIEEILKANAENIKFLKDEYPIASTKLDEFVTARKEALAAGELNDEVGDLSP